MGAMAVMEVMVTAMRWRQSQMRTQTVMVKVAVTAARAVATVAATAKAPATVQTTVMTVVMKLRWTWNAAKVKAALKTKVKRLRKRWLTVQELLLLVGVEADGHAARHLRLIPPPVRSRVKFFLRNIQRTAMALCTARSPFPAPLLTRLRLHPGTIAITADSVVGTDQPEPRPELLRLEAERTMKRKKKHGKRTAMTLERRSRCKT
mmetsp:Transcript_9257/g.15936  ORF Transcript_9257/g.15936 Transcript_9257/m.15936 type:complete len:206 (+) Transcript_9257:1441-2058(+)